MIFKSLEIQNFMAIKEANINLENQGLVLIQGVNNDNPNFMSNGAGKSTIIESIVYVLFGRTIRGIKGDDVVSNVTKKNCKVMLDLVDDDGTEYRIARYRKHYQNKNNVYLYCNGKDITPKSEADFTKKIIDILQTDFMTFTSSILYSAESFRFTQATDSELKSAFDVMLDLKVYSDCQEEVKNQLRELSFNQETLNNKRVIIEQRECTYKESIDDIEKQKKSYIEEQSVKIENMKFKKQEFESLAKSYDEDILKYKKSMGDLSYEIEELKKNKKSSTKNESMLEQLRETLDDEESNKSSVKSSIRGIDSDIEQYNRELKIHNKSISDCKDKIKSNEQKLIDLQNTVGTPCPVCGKPLDADHIVDAVNECNTAIQKCNNDIEEHNKSILDIQEKIKNLESNKESFNQELSDIDDHISELNELIKKVKNKIAKEQETDNAIIDKEKKRNKYENLYNSAILNQDKLKYDAENLEKQISELSDTGSTPYDRQIESLKSNLSELPKEYIDIDEQLDKLASEKQVLDFWLQGFSNAGIKSMLLDDITPFLNKRANKYLSVMSGDHLTVNFTTQTRLKSGEVRDKFQIELINEDGGTSYMSNSSGEKRRVDVAINLALCDLISSRANKKINVLIADEIFDSLDSNGVESVMNLLRELSKEKSSIFVISHNDSIKSYFDKTLTVTKTNGQSTVTFEG